jgi:hypothetical protein
MGGYTSTFSGQWLRKHVPTAKDMDATTEELVFYVLHAKML